ncbi:hypothetical protein WJX81_007543 [Elliptochloris bilobata]|uniref:Programmed cell death protein 2 C-terminal domain-containing protein n=1 Tax=Elliptochloris bilobata TaxID=381761 RepID=A0AAW1QI59_9CHLO
MVDTQLPQWLDEDDQLDCEDDDEHQWILGLVDETKAPQTLLRHRFSSKVGGRPAWLHPVRLPAVEALTSQPDGRPLVFLLQVYAPVEDSEAAFHRMLYLFLSPHSDRLAGAGAARALRCQLPRHNAYYSPDPPSTRLPLPLPEDDMGCLLTRDPWRAAAAEAALSAGEPAPWPGVRVLPELAIRDELEEPEADASEGGWEAADLSGENGASAALAPEEAAMESELVDEVEAQVDPGTAAFATFAARVARRPQQVLRYCFEDGARPLWPGAECVPSAADVPPCVHCRAPRRFEFQVLPQLLNWLNADESGGDGMDWGAIAVFCCTASCTPPPHAESAYLEEFAWVQPP